MAADSTTKRRALAGKTINAARQYVDALNALIDLREERGKLADPFIDADFVTDGLRHLTAAQMGQLYDFVIPNLQTNYIDVANGGRNEQILIQVCP